MTQTRRAREEPAPRLSRQRVLTLVLVAGTAIFVVLCVAIALPFAAPLTWALALAVVGAPMHRWICRRLGNDNVCAAAAALIVAIVIIAPVFFVTQQLVWETTAALQRLQESGSVEAFWKSAGQRHAWLQPAAQWIESLRPAEQFQQAATEIVKRVSSFVTASLWVAAKLLITLFALFFFFRDRRKALDAVASMTPLTDREVDDLSTRVADTIHATVFGTLLVALLQGTLGGLMFWWLGLPAPVLWGTVMGLLAVVPVLGAFVVWVPVAVWLAIDGQWAKAIVLSGWGGIVIGLIDNLLYPIFVGKKLRLHTLLMFIAIVGGLILFGAAGLILGPCILAITDGLLTIWRERTSPAPAREHVDRAAGRG